MLKNNFLDFLYLKSANLKFDEDLENPVSSNTLSTMDRKRKTRSTVSKTRTSKLREELYKVRI